LRSLHRITARLLLAPVLALGWGLAPAHVHQAAAHDDDHHDEAVAHRHLAPHERDHEDHDAAEVAESSDAGVVWLDETPVPLMAYQLRVPPAAPAAVVEPVYEKPFWHPGSQYDAAPAHGPPRSAVTFRGPPLLPTC
jgi:hypothetical protein